MRRALTKRRSEPAPLPAAKQEDEWDSDGACGTPIQPPIASKPSPPAAPPPGGRPLTCVVCGKSKGKSVKSQLGNCCRKELAAAKAQADERAREDEYDIEMRTYLQQAEAALADGDAEPLREFLKDFAEACPGTGRGKKRSKYDWVESRFSSYEKKFCRKYGRDIMMNKNWFFLDRGNRGWTEEDKQYEWDRIVESTPEYWKDYAGPRSDRVRYPCPNLDVVERGHEKGQEKSVETTTKRQKMNDKSAEQAEGLAREMKFKAWGAREFQVGSGGGPAPSEFVASSGASSQPASSPPAAEPADPASRRGGAARKQSEAETATPAAKKARGRVEVDSFDLYIKAYGANYDKIEREEVAVAAAIEKADAATKAAETAHGAEAVPPPLALMLQALAARRGALATIQQPKAAFAASLGALGEKHDMKHIPVASLELLKSLDEIKSFLVDKMQACTSKETLHKEQEHLDSDLDTVKAVRVHVEQACAFIQNFLTSQQQKRENEKKHQEKAAAKQEKEAKKAEEKRRQTVPRASGPVASDQDVFQRLPTNTQQAPVLNGEDGQAPTSGAKPFKWRPPKASVAGTEAPAFKAFAVQFLIDAPSAPTFITTQRCQKSRLPEPVVAAVKETMLAAAEWADLLQEIGGKAGLEPYEALSAYASRCKKVTHYLMSSFIISLLHYMSILQ